jgi:hypothetical protein
VREFRIFYFKWQSEGFYKKLILWRWAGFRFFISRKRFAIWVELGSAQQIKQAKLIVANTARGEFPNSSPPSKQ